MGFLTLKPHLLPGDLCSWREWDVTDSRLNAPHWHRDFREIFWITAGQGTHQINDQKFSLRAQMLIMVHQRDRHWMAPSPGKYLRFVNLAFPIRNWVYLQQRYWPDQPDPFASTEQQKHLSFHSIHWAQLQQASEELRHCRSGRNRAVLERFLLNFYFLMQSAARTPVAPNEVTCSDWLDWAIARMNEPQLIREGLPAFLRLCNRSREHVARVSRKQLGRSPTELVNDLRLAAAAVHLAQTDRKILAISLSCGFRHLGHFYKEFARRYYVTPNAYRRRQQQLVRAGATLVRPDSTSE